MFEWIKKIIGNTIFKTEDILRCNVCYLRAKHEVVAVFTELETEELSEIKINICQGCLDEIKIKMGVKPNENERQSERTKNMER